MALLIYILESHSMNLNVRLAAVRPTEHLHELGRCHIGEPLLDDLLRSVIGLIYQPPERFPSQINKAVLAHNDDPLSLLQPLTLLTAVDQLAHFSEPPANTTGDRLDATAVLFFCQHEALITGHRTSLLLRTQLF